jgi:hypothetical protein
MEAATTPTEATEKPGLMKKSTSFARSVLPGGGKKKGLY